MALKRVTIQNIADACGLSRNTVSKVFNGRGSVPETTRHIVLQKAQELGYYQLPDNAAPDPVPQNGNIALLTHSKPLNHSFGSHFITAFTDQICRAGYNLKMYEISDRELEARTLPPHLLLKDTAGILGIELFDKGYLDMLCAVGMPMICVDSFADAGTSIMHSDLVVMENYASTFSLTKHMLVMGAKTIGFVGDIRHCLSFEERWLGYCAAMTEANRKPGTEYSILAKDSIMYGNPDWYRMQLDKMPQLPDAFLCANDYIAIHLMTALKKKGISIPGDIMVGGFDGSPESSVVEPALTTVQIPSNEMGRITADILLNRIQNPERPYLRTYIHTTPVFRGSTR